MVSLVSLRAKSTNFRHDIGSKPKNTWQFDKLNARYKKDCHDNELSKNRARRN